MNGNASRSAGNQPTGTLERGLSILSLYARHGELAPLQVAEKLSLSKSAVYRLIGTLAERGFLEAVPETKRFRLGPRSAEVGMAALAELDVVQAAGPSLRALSEQTAETSFLAVVVDDSVVYVHREDGPQSVTLSSRLGSRRYLHSTALGKAYMSALEPGSWTEVVGALSMPAVTPNTITDPELMLAELATVAERGYAIDNMEGEDGVGCFAAPVRDHRGVPVAAISIAGPSERVLPHESTFAPQVTAAAESISRRLGYFGADKENAL